MNHQWRIHSQQFCLWLASFGCAFVPFAASGAESPKDSRIEEVVVTATFRETNLMDTPQAISAVTDSLVRDTGAQSMEDLYTMVAGLSMSGSVEGHNRYTIRGATSQSGNIGYAPVGATVGVYLDGTPVTAALGPDKQINGALFDIDRVEVLKGPQGTLFGEGSQSGTIRFLYKQPDPSKFDFAVAGSLADMAESDDTSNRLDGMINVPLGDGFALRMTAWTSEAAGFITNLAPYEQDFNHAKSTGGRAALRYERDSFSITGSFYHSKQETNGGSATFSPYQALYARIPGLAPYSEDEADIYSVAGEVDLGWATLQSQTSYTDRKLQSIVEATRVGAAGLDYFYGGSTQADPTDPLCIAIGAAFGLCPGWPGALNPPPPIPPTFIPDGKNLLAISGIGDNYSKRWVQEFRLVSPGDNGLRWTAGAFWKNSKDHTGNSQVAGYYPGREAFGLAFDPLLRVPANTHSDYLEEYALFGEVSYDLTHTLELTVGARVSELRQDFTNTDSNTDDTPVSPKVVLSWRPSDTVLVYGTFSTGFRPGNVNNNMEFYVEGQELIRQGVINNPSLTDAEKAAAVATINARIDAFRANLLFDGDKVYNYELGLKTTLLDRVTLQTSLYYLDWEDMIVYQNHPLNGDVFNANSGAAEIEGIEMEVNTFITDNFSVRLVGDYHNSKVTQGSAATNGNELIYSPKENASVALNYSLPISGGWILDFYLDRAWVASQFIDSANTTKMPSFQKSNARITLNSPDEKWRVALFGTNLDNEEIQTNRTRTGEFYWQPPRQVGLELGYHH